MVGGSSENPTDPLMSRPAAVQLGLGGRRVYWPPLFRGKVAKIKKRVWPKNGWGHGARLFRTRLSRERRPPYRSKEGNGNSKLGPLRGGGKCHVNDQWKPYHGGAKMGVCRIHWGLGGWGSEIIPTIFGTRVGYLEFKTRPPRGGKRRRKSKNFHPEKRKGFAAS